MADVEIKFDSKKALQFFDTMAKNLSDITEKQKLYVNSISPFVFRDYIEHFDKEMGPTGRWKSWSAVYRERQIKRGKGSNKILQDNGRLRNTFKATNYRKAPEGVLWFNDAKTAKGFPYAAAHEDGDGNLPKRSFMWLTQKAIDNIAKTTVAFLTRGL